jgi:hypothetical protein
LHIFTEYKTISKQGLSKNSFQYFEDNKELVHAKTPPQEVLRLCTHDSIIHGIWLPKLYELGITKVNTVSIVGEVIGHSALYLSHQYRRYANIPDGIDDLQFALDKIDYLKESRFQLNYLFNECKKLAQMIKLKDPVFQSMLDQTTRELLEEEINEVRNFRNKYSQEVKFSTDSTELRNDNEIQSQVAKINSIIQTILDSESSSE